VLQTRKVLVLCHASLTACGATLQSGPHFFATISQFHCCN